MVLQISRRMLFEQDLVDQKKEDEEKLMIELVSVIVMFTEVLY